MAEHQRLRERVDARVAAVLDRRTVDRLSTPSSRAVPPPAAIIALALATVVHLSVLTLLAGGVGLVVAGDNLVQRLAGIVLLLPVLLLVRRPHRDGADEVTPEAAPVLTDLVAEVAGALGTRPPTYLGIDEDTNAYARRSGLRTRTLVLGAPLWVALGPQARIALLGHELGHFARRDVVHGRYVGTALATLQTWADASSPGEERASNLGHTPIIATVALWPMRMASTGSLRVLGWVNSAASRRAELLADLESAVVAGTPATIEVLELMLAADVIDRAANRAAVDPRRPDLAVEIRARVTALDERDHAEALLASGERSGIDRTHPPTGERLRLQRSLPPSPGTIVLDAERVAAIDGELRPFLDAALRRRADWYR
ncbi:M48 family metalloprotease [Nocardioides lianchengensis]|uniref:Zn-dependent protease with chaperone function n=1 Tax=Nocardioides lianchengensis TaxID=1045774 RepID=A0A1G6RK68_9ACTN|nr:M48 family metallopeptidase [Nocardioides lianchengensis]NYG10211.1 Zn-dependent protease with chaperone function [Nocardioides lianchengensis]SDD04783.1 Zn-dependent protease with chaperone function [Nocardioides lianchengensis]